MLTCERILVVDDDWVIRRLIAATLTLEGFDVATAVDGQDCLDKIPAVAPDIVTLEAAMPRLDGWETAARLRQDPDTSHIKVVLITARTQDDDRARQSCLGIDAFLARPFDAAEMVREIRKLAGASRASSHWASESPGLWRGKTALSYPES